MYTEHTEFDTLSNIRNTVDYASGRIIDNFVLLYLYPNHPIRWQWEQTLSHSILKLPRIKWLGIRPTASWMYKQMAKVARNRVYTATIFVQDDHGVPERIEFDSADIESKCNCYFEWLCNMLSKHGKVTVTEIYQKLDTIL